MSDYSFAGKNTMLYLKELLNKLYALKSHTHTKEEITDLTIATTLLEGLMSASDKTKLDGIDEGANNYSLPIASETELGGIKVGDNLEIVNGILSAINTTYSKLSEFTNDTNYQTEDDVSTAIENAIANITGISFSIVTELPATGETGVMYLISNNSSETNNFYDEYLWINDTFEKIGTTKIDTSEYVKITDLEEISNDELDEIFA